MDEAPQIDRGEWLTEQIARESKVAANYHKNSEQDDNPERKAANKRYGEGYDQRVQLLIGMLAVAEEIEAMS